MRDHASLPFRKGIYLVVDTYGKNEEEFLGTHEELGNLCRGKTKRVVHCRLSNHEK